MFQTFSDKLSAQSRTYQTCQQSDDNLDGHGLEESPLVGKSERSHHLALFVSLVCFSAFGFIAGMAGNRYWTMDAAKFCTLEVSQDSPLLEDVKIEYNIERFHGSLMEENVFRQSAGPKVDAAWKSLGIDYRSIVVPSELAERSGFQSDQVKVAEKYGGGYLANVEGLSNLHCLNLLRQSLYYNYDHYKSQGEGEFGNDADILQRQVSQCLDVLRQQLMCTVDIGVQGQRWQNPSSPQPFIDADTRHKCRNFDAVRDWAEKHQVPEEVPEDYIQMPRKGDIVYKSVL